MCVTPRVPGPIRRGAPQMAYYSNELVCVHGLPRRTWPGQNAVVSGIKLTWQLVCTDCCLSTLHAVLAPRQPPRSRRAGGTVARNLRSRDLLYYNSPVYTDLCNLRARQRSPAKGVSVTASAALQVPGGRANKGSNQGFHRGH